MLFLPVADVGRLLPAVDLRAVTHCTGQAAQIFLSEKHDGGDRLHATHLGVQNAACIQADAVTFCGKASLLLSGDC